MTWQGNQAGEEGAFLHKWSHPGQGGSTLAASDRGSVYPSPASSSARLRARQSSPGSQWTMDKFKCLSFFKCRRKEVGGVCELRTCGGLGKGNLRRGKSQLGLWLFRFATFLFNCLQVWLRCPHRGEETGQLYSGSWRLMVASSSALGMLTTFRVLSSLDCVHRLEGNKKMTWPEGTLPSSLKWRECCSTWWDMRLCLYYFVAFRNVLVLLSKIWKGTQTSLDSSKTSKLSASMKKRVNDFFLKAETIFEPFFQRAPPISEVLILPNSSLKLLHLKFYLPIFICLLYWVPACNLSLKFDDIKLKN